MTHRSDLVKRADALWRQIVREMFEGMCARCHKPGWEAHHVIRNRYLATRWALMNGIFLCTDCHCIVQLSLSAEQAVLDRYSAYRDWNYETKLDRSHLAGTTDPAIVVTIRELGSTLKQIRAVRLFPRPSASVQP